MKNFFKNHGLWVLVATAIIAVALALMSYFSSTSSPLVNVTNTLTAPFRTGYTAVANWFNDWQNHYRDVTALEQENAELRKKVAEMEAAVRQAEADSAENVLLRQLLNLREQRRDLTDFEAALITEHAVSNWASTLTVNKGTNHGVEVNDCVIDATGAMVGIVSETGFNWSTIRTLEDTDTSLGAQVFRTRDLGVAEGNFALMEDGLLTLKYLPAECRLLSGDLIVTSGLGGYYPSGLVIGSVHEIRPNDSGAEAYAVVKPAVNPDDLSEVFIIKSFDIVT